MSDDMLTGLLAIVLGTTVIGGIYGCMGSRDTTRSPEKNPLAEKIESRVGDDKDCLEVEK